MDENEAGAGGLDADVAAYFESRGEKLPEDKPAEQASTATEKPADAVSADKAAQAAVEGDKQPTTVPLRALQEEREEKKALRAEREDMARKLAVLEDRWATMLAMANQPEQTQDADPEPDPTKDIFAHNAWLGRQLARERQIREESAKQTAEQRQAAEREQQVWNFWHQDAAVFKSQNTDFDDVVKWMSEERSKQLQALSGLNPAFRTEQGIAAQINAELADIVVKAAQAGISPAKYVHDLGKSWGYKGKAPEPEPAKLIEQANKGKDAELSLSQLGGSSNPGPKTAEDVAAMSTAEFEAWLEKNPKGFKRIMGG